MHDSGHIPPHYDRLTIEADAKREHADCDHDPKFYGYLCAAQDVCTLGCCLVLGYRV